MLKHKLTPREPEEITNLTALDAAWRDEYRQLLDTYNRTKKALLRAQREREEAQSALNDVMRRFYVQ